MYPRWIQKSPKKATDRDGELKIRKNSLKFPVDAIVIQADIRACVVASQTGCSAWNSPVLFAVRTIRISLFFHSLDVFYFRFTVFVMNFIRVYLRSVKKMILYENIQILSKAFCTLFVRAVRIPICQIHEFIQDWRLVGIKSKFIVWEVAFYVSGFGNPGIAIWQLTAHS